MKDFSRSGTRSYNLFPAPHVWHIVNGESIKYSKRHPSTRLNPDPDCVWMNAQEVAFHHQAALGHHLERIH